MNGLKLLILLKSPKNMFHDQSLTKPLDFVSEANERS